MREEREKRAMRTKRDSTAGWESIQERDSWRRREEEGRYERSLTKGNPICTARRSLPLLRNRVRFSRARTRWRVSREERRSRMYFGYVFSFTRIVVQLVSNFKEKWHSLLIFLLSSQMLSSSRTAYFRICYSDVFLFLIWLIKGRYFEIEKRNGLKLTNKLL